MKVFIDTNIVLDLLLQRRNFLINAEKIFSLAYKGKIVLDIEDGYQYFTAKENNIHIMITRNVKDFLVDDISIVTPEEFLMISC